MHFVASHALRSGYSTPILVYWLNSKDLKKIRLLVLVQIALPLEGLLALRNAYLEVRSL